jgi:hypothetical protein
MGPVELIVIKFRGNKFTGNVAPALRELVDSGTIGVIDLLFAVTDQQGNIAVLELSDLDNDTAAEFDPIVKDLTGLLTHDDARAMARDIGPNSSLAVLLFENKWATKFRDAVLEANGELVLSERIPKVIVDGMAEPAA